MGQVFLNIILSKNNLLRFFLEILQKRTPIRLILLQMLSKHIKKNFIGKNGIKNGLVGDLPYVSFRQNLTR